MTRDQTYPKNLVHLIHLARRLYHTQKIGLIGNNAQFSELNIANFTDEVLDVAETEKLLDIIQKDELLFYSVGANTGVSRVYLIARIDERANLPNDVQELLRFRQRQLPEQYTFENLSKLFCYTTGPNSKKPAAII